MDEVSIIYFILPTKIYNHILINAFPIFFSLTTQQEVSCSLF